MSRMLRTLSLVALLGVALPAFAPSPARADAGSTQVDLGIPKPVMKFLKDHWKMLYIAVDELIDDLTGCDCKPAPTSPPPDPDPDPTIG